MATLRMQTNILPFVDRDLQLLLDLALETAAEVIKREWKSAYTYHDPEHSRLVVQSAELLAHDLGVSEEERATVLIAAAFHDCGFYSDMDDHENVSASIAADFLIAHNAPLAMISKTTHLIQATALHARPVNDLQEILRDADLHYLGCDGFLPQAELLRQEWKATRNLSFGELAWLRQNVKFMETHRFHTKAAQVRYGAQKEKNIAELKRAVVELAAHS